MLRMFIRVVSARSASSATRLLSERAAGTSCEYTHGAGGQLFEQLTQRRRGRRVRRELRSGSGFNCLVADDADQAETTRIDFFGICKLTGPLCGLCALHTSA